MSDYTFMKSGFGNDNLPKLDDGIIAMITLFSDDSLCVAETYSIHSGRNEISPLDLKKALKVRARYGKQFWSLPGVKERLEIISKKLKDSDTTETMEEDIHNASAITVDTRSTTADCCAGILLNETNTASTEPSQKSREVGSTMSLTCDWRWTARSRRRVPVPQPPPNRRFALGNAAFLR